MTRTFAKSQTVRSDGLGRGSSSAPQVRTRARGRAILTLAGAALAMLVAPAIAAPRLRLVWNVSPSVPLGLYRIESGAPVAVGDLAGVRPPPALARFMAGRRYVEEGALLLKPVAAQSGAMVCRNEGLITIDGKAVAAALREDRLGRALPIWSGCRRLGRQELFLLAAGRLESFDGRYFGPVEATMIVGRAVPLWTW